MLSEEKYAQMAARRYREYLKQEQRKSRMQSIVALLLRILKMLSDFMSKIGIKKNSKESVVVE